MEVKENEKRCRKERKNHDWGQNHAKSQKRKGKYLERKSDLRINIKKTKTKAGKT